MQSPLQVDVCVQIELLEQSLAPTIHGTRDEVVVVLGNVMGVGVAMQAPPHGFVGTVQYSVGVHVEPVGQGPLLPTVQGISGGKVWMLRQRPPQVEV